jgi:DNA-binding beta-propeller fold protein YncE
MMGTMAIKQSAIIALSILVFSMGTGGCRKQSVNVGEVDSDLVWPQAPEIARIRFAGSISEPGDIQIREGMFKRFFNYILGKDKVSIAAPYGIEIDAAGRLYVVDTALKTVHVFDTVKNEYFRFTTKKTFFISPIDIAIDDKTGFIYVSDSTQKVVKIFKDFGRVFVGEIGKGIFERPTGIDINEKTSELLIVDTLSANILRYNLVEHSFKGIFGGGGSGKGQLHFPTNIFATKTGTILVTDSLNFRVQIYSSGGKFLRTFGSEGDQSGYFTRPRGVAADSEGNIYVVDALFDNVQIFDQQGRLLMAFGDHGNGYGQFWMPTGILIDKKDMIYVSDSYNKRIQMFKYLKGE